MYWRKKTPTVIQMEALECGAACLGIILGYFGSYVPLEKLRVECGVSRDGSNALNMIKAGRSYGLEGKGFQKDLEELYELKRPAVIFWHRNHFVVLEGFGKKKVYINDPASGPRSISYKEFHEGYSGIALIFTPQKGFQPSGRPPNFHKELFRRLSKVHQALFYIFLAGLCLILPGLALPAFARIFIDQALASHFLSWKWAFLGCILVAGILGGILIWLQNYFLNRLNGRLAIQFSSQFLWHILRLPLSFYSQRFAGEIAYRSTLNNRVAQQMTGKLARACIDLLLIIFYGLVMFSYDVLIGSIGICTAFFNIAIFIWVQRSRLDSYACLQQEMGKWVGNAIGSLQSIETIKARGIEPDAFSRYMGFYTKVLNAHQMISKKDTFLAAAPVLSQSLTIAALLIIGSLRVMDGTLTFGMLVALQILMMSFLTPIAHFVNFGQTMQNLKTDINRLNDVLNNQIDSVYLNRPSHSPSSLKLEGRLEFRNVTFGYNRLDPPLISNFSFIIKPGLRLALVGPSGCGKSTIAKLATGLFQPWEGEILYDGKPLFEIPLDVLYNSISHIDQEIALFSGTVLDNLTLWNASLPQEMVIRAAEDSAIHDDIMQRKGGYESLLIEGGKNLSGGQRQRLEIARALIYSPSLIIMDEATSALDSEIEKKISDNIRRRGCSALMIAHRLSTIQDCDEILVLKQGQIIERGTHEELKNTKGLYSQLSLREKKI